MDFKMLKKLRLSIRVYALAVKYWIRGDTWEHAIDMATVIVGGFKRV